MNELDSTTVFSENNDSIHHRHGPIHTYPIDTIKVPSRSIVCQRSLAREIHASLYCSNIQYQHTAINLHYARDAVFEDPIISIIGIPSILAKFRALTWFPCINVTVNSIYESVSVRPEQHSQAYVVVIDAWLIVTLVPNLIKFPLRNISRLEFDDHNLIRRHEDIWSLSDMFASLPIGLGWMYDIARSVNGIVGSVVIDGITWGFKNIHQGKKGNIYQGY